MTSLRVAGVVLAAGASSRMDAGFKMLLPWRSGTVVEAAVEAALGARLEPVVVVTGHRGDEVAGALERASRPPADRLRVAHNPRWAEGQATSLARGIREVRTATEAAAAAVLLGDEPGIRVDAVRDVVAAWRRRAASISGSGRAPSPGGGQGPPTSPPGTSRPDAASSPSSPRPPVMRARYRDRPGHPVVFPRGVFPELERLEGDRGARAWLDRNAEAVEEVRLDEAAPTDVDTDADHRERERSGRGERGEGSGSGAGLGRARSDPIE